MVLQLLPLGRAYLLSLDSSQELRMAIPFSESVQLPVQGQTVFRPRSNEPPKQDRQSLLDVF